MAIANTSCILVFLKSGEQHVLLLCGDEPPPNSVVSIRSSPTQQGLFIWLGLEVGWGAGVLLASPQEAHPSPQGFRAFRSQVRCQWMMTLRGAWHWGLL